MQAGVDRIIPGGHSREVADLVYFGDFRHAGVIILALKLRRNDFVERGFRNIERRQHEARATRMRTLKDQLLVMAEVRSYLDDVGFHYKHLPRRHEGTKRTSPSLLCVLVTLWLIFLSAPRPAHRSALACLFPSRKPENRLAGSHQNVPVRSRRRFPCRAPAYRAAARPQPARARQTH